VEDRNKNTIYQVMIAVLVILLVLCVSYILFGKKLISSKEKTPEVEENIPSEEKVQSRNLTEIEKSTLMEQIELYNLNFASYYPMMDVNSISNHDLFTFAHKQLSLSNVQSEFSASDIDSVVSKYFGSLRKLKHEDYICDIDGQVFYQYDSVSKKYTFNQNTLHGHGGGSKISDSKSLFIEGKSDGNVYTVKAKVLYGMICGDICGPNNAYYVRYSDIGKNPVIEDKNVMELSLTDELILQNGDKIPVVTYTFKKDEQNNFGLTSVE